MAKNIEIQINTGNNVYETIYPKTLGSLISGIVNEATTSLKINDISIERLLYKGTGNGEVNILTFNNPCKIVIIFCTSRGSNAFGSYKWNMFNSSINFPPQNQYVGVFYSTTGSGSYKTIVFNSGAYDSIARAFACTGKFNANTLTLTYLGYGWLYNGTSFDTDNNATAHAYEALYNANQDYVAINISY